VGAVPYRSFSDQWAPTTGRQHPHPIGGTNFQQSFARADHARWRLRQLRTLM
jgi:hypothetical protein